MTNSIRKGKAGERELAAAMRHLGYHGARRSQQYCGTEGDADIADAIPGVFIECKRVQALNIEAAVARACLDAHPKRQIPVVMHRKNRGNWMVTVLLDDLGRLADAVVSSRTQPSEPAT